MIPDSFIQSLLARSDIVDIINRHVPLKKTGANYTACCPFHQEKTPSFSVSPDKQFYYCFGCGASGSVIGFLMQYTGADFVDAVESLARDAGMSVPQTEPSHRQAHLERTAPLVEIMGRAARFYREQLRQAPRAIEYLKSRGLNGDIARRFGLGYAPDDWQGLKALFPNYEDPALQECGLVTSGAQGRRYDRFRDRIMFPITDSRGNVIAFGARFIGDHKAVDADHADRGPKYLNSPETPLFQKGRELYGLNQARAALRAQDQVVVVEGYMDVVALAQYGIGNAVATLGTACTPEHVRTLLRLSARLVFCFDGDAAGYRAAWRALESSLPLLDDKHRIGFLFLPSDQDPDSYVRSQGPDAFRAQAASPVELAAFLMRELRQGLDLKESAQDRAQLVTSAAPYLQKLGAPALRTQLVRAVADAALISPAETEALCGLQPVAKDRNRYAPVRKQRAPVSFAHRLLEIIVRHPAWSARLPMDIIPRDSVEAQAIHALADAINHGELPAGGTGLLLEFVRGKPYESLIVQIITDLADPAQETSESAIEREFEDALIRLQARQIGATIKAGHYQSPEELRDLLARKTQKTLGQG
jgi:DNA primase